MAGDSSLCSSKSRHGSSLRVITLAFIHTNYRQQGSTSTKKILPSGDIPMVPDCSLNFAKSSMCTSPLETDVPHVLPLHIRSWRRTYRFLSVTGNALKYNSSTTSDQYRPSFVCSTECCKNPAFSSSL